MPAFASADCSSCSDLPEDCTRFKASCTHVTIACEANERPTCEGDFNLSTSAIVGIVLGVFAVLSVSARKFCKQKDPDGYDYSHLHRVLGRLQWQQRARR